MAGSIIMLEKFHMVANQSAKSHETISTLSNLQYAVSSSMCLDYLFIYENTAVGNCCHYYNHP